MTCAMGSIAEVSSSFNFCTYCKIESIWGRIFLHLFLSQFQVGEVGHVANVFFREGHGISLSPRRVKYLA